MQDSIPAAAPQLFPSLDSLESVLWPGAALAVFVITAVIVDLMIILATRWRLVDLPNRRSAHVLPTARGGGVAIVLVTTLATIGVVFRWPQFATNILVGVCLPCLAIAGVGIVDDIRPLKATLRLVIQIAVGVAMTAVLGPLEEIAIPGLPAVHLGSLGWPLTVLWIVGMTNAFNFMDGSDGMAGLAAVTSGAVLAAIAWQLRWHPALLMAALAAAAAAGFLVFNWQPARVFMGDVGSAFLGTYLAAMPLLFPEPQRSFVIVAAIMGLWPFIFDPLVSVIRRVANGKNPMEPHREFLFHRLIRSGVSHAATAAIYAALAVAGGMVGMLMLADWPPVALRTAGPLVVAGLAVALACGIEYRCARVGLTATGGLPQAAGGQPAAASK